MIILVVASFDFAQRSSIKSIFNDGQQQKNVKKNMGEKSVCVCVMVVEKKK